MPSSPAPLSALTRERLRLYRRILVASAVVGAAFGLRLSMDAGAVLFNVLVGVANALVIAGSLAGIEIFLLREGARAQRRLAALPFVLVLALKTLAYGALVAVVVMYSGRVAALVFPSAGGAPPSARTQLLLIGLSLGTSLVFVVFLQAAGLVGRRTFRELLLGRYRRPRAERRFFLFVDVVGSTAIAERLGPLQAHRFLSAVFSATAEPVAAMDGEIYQYVGDEIVVTWTQDEGAVEARALRCFFLMEAALRARAGEFRERFAAEPGLRAALHLGEVIAGEVGVMRRAIVYHGDVMNTAARLEQATREVGCRFIASAEAVDALSVDEEFKLKDLGTLNLRGRQQAIRAWAVDTA